MNQVLKIAGSDTSASPASRGSNQSGMRAYNERLVLSLIRQSGAMAKAGIAREGAFFLGLKVGRRSLELVLTDFFGCKTDRVQKAHCYPTPDGVVALKEVSVPGVEAPKVDDGAIGRDARTLGAASLPLSERFLTDRNAFLKGWNT